MCDKCDNFDDIEDWTMRYDRMGKIQRFVKHWRLGCQDGYPICCVLRFSIENALADGKTLPMSKGVAIRRGVVNDGTGKMFVPCNLFHYKNEDWNWD